MATLLITPQYLGISQDPRYISTTIISKDDSQLVFCNLQDILKGRCMLTLIGHFSGLVKSCSTKVRFMLGTVRWTDLREGETALCLYKVSTRLNLAHSRAHTVPSSSWDTQATQWQVPHGLLSCLQAQHTSLWKQCKGSPTTWKLGNNQRINFPLSPSLFRQHDTNNVAKHPRCFKIP